MKLGNSNKVFLKPASFSFLATVLGIEETVVNSKDGKKQYKQNLIHLAKGSDYLYISDWDVLPCDIESGNIVNVTCSGVNEKIQISKIETV